MSRNADYVCASFFVAPGLIEYAVEQDTLIGGDDFKSGQTKLKSVLVDFLIRAGLKVRV